MQIEFPDTIKRTLEEGATLAISISGGKDSQAMLYAVMDAYSSFNWPCHIFAIHADLGKMEWPQSLPFCQSLAAEVGIELTVVRRPQGDLLQEMKDREEKLAGTGKPHFPSATNRYCTADQKRAQIDKVLRAAPFPDSKNRYCTSHHKTNQIDKVLRESTVVISAEGVRADESPARAKRPAWELREQICTRTRIAYNWRPLLRWSEDDVWAKLGTSRADVDRRQTLYRSGQIEEAFEGWRGHPAYVMGNQRVSCALCVLASRNDIANGARHNPELYQELVAMEQRTGFSFRQDLRLSDLDLNYYAPIKPIPPVQPQLFEVMTCQ